MDFATQQQFLVRQRRLADLLRAEAEQQPAYQELPGRMISGRYVAPSWSQSLNNLVAPMAQRSYANKLDTQVGQQEQAYGAAVEQARQQWQSALPQTIAGRPELQGPQAAGGSPELAAAPPQLPDRATVLKATLAGMQIPGNEKAALLWNQGMGQEWEREDKQQEFARLQAERLQQTKELRLQQLQQQERELRARLEQQERENIRDNQTRLMHQQTLMAIAAMKAGDTSKTDAVDARAVANDITKLSTRMAAVTPVLDAAQQVQDLIDVYTDPKTGKTRPIPGLGYVGALPGWARSAAQEVGVISPASNANRAVIERLVGNIMRNQAGLSQTISEQARVLQTMLSSGSYSQADFMKAWGSFVQNLDAELNNIKAGHRPEAVDKYIERGGRLSGPKARLVVPTTPAQQEAVRLTEADPTAAKRARLEELRAKAAAKVDW